MTSLKSHQRIIRERMEQEEASLDMFGTWWDTERDLPRVTTGTVDRVKRLRALGNGIVPASLALFLMGVQDAIH